MRSGTVSREQRAFNSLVRCCRRDASFDNLGAPGSMPGADGPSARNSARPRSVERNK